MERNPVYDRAKGIGMILVIYGHMFMYGGIPFTIIFSFHMPLFFIISGMLLSADKFNGMRFNSWVKICLKKYMPPFVFFSIMGGIVRFLYSGNIDCKRVISQFIFHIGSDELFTGALWFIGILMAVMILMPIINKFGGQKIISQLLVLLVLIVISYILSMVPITLPFLIKIIPGVLFFVYIGFIWKKPIMNAIGDKLIKRFITFGLPIFLLLSLLNKTINMSIPIYNDGAIFLICALYGTMFVLMVSCYQMPKFIDYLGKNSLIVFSLHAIFITFFTDSLNYWLGTSYMPMVDIPIHYVLIGGVIVIAMTALSTVLILPVYNRMLSLLKLK